MIHFMALLQNSFLLAREAQASEALTDTAHQIADHLQVANENYRRLMSNQPSEILVLDQTGMYDAMITRAISEIRTANESLTPEDVLTVEYICKYAAQLVTGMLAEGRTEIPGKPYVFEYLEKGDFQTAGDAALYGYWFLLEKRHNRLAAQDYLHLAEQSYFRWFGRSPYSIGYIVGSRVQKLVPKIGNLPRKTFEMKSVMV